MKATIVTTVIYLLITCSILVFSLCGYCFLKNKICYQIASEVLIHSIPQMSRALKKM